MWDIEIAWNTADFAGSCHPARHWEQQKRERSSEKYLSHDLQNEAAVGLERGCDAVHRGCGAVSPRPLPQVSDSYFVGLSPKRRCELMPIIGVLRLANAS